MWYSEAMQTLIQNSKELAALRAIFVLRGYDMWFVGGCTRDTLLGLSPKDIDLATSATPEEQIEIYREQGIRYIETGLQHGTITAVLDQPYEITSLRTETNHDGRHAEVAYTRDLAEDLGRRDLTINAMALSFDGDVIDPFGGADDLKAGRVRFVGEASERMTEDYLRILRFFRFHARFANGADLDPDAARAIQQTRAGLSKISVERIWDEMGKIISGPNAISTLRQMIDMSLFEIIQMPYGYFDDLARGIEVGIRDRAALMGVYTDVQQIKELSLAWKWSRADHERALFMSRNTLLGQVGSPAIYKEMLVDGVDREWVRDLAAFFAVDWAELRDWEIPVFPVSGADLIARGVKPSPLMGDMISRMKDVWKSSDYRASKDELLAEV
jgi:tRNA nucleotidyltransferase (CCA-adding enzyme)